VSFGYLQHIAPCQVHRKLYTHESRGFVNREALKMAIMVKAVSQVSDLVENGVYPAKLTSIRQFANAYGPRPGFDFTLGGNGAGKTITRSTAPNFTKESKLAELIRALSEIEPSPIELSEGFDLEALVGSDHYPPPQSKLSDPSSSAREKPVRLVASDFAACCSRIWPCNLPKRSSTASWFIDKSCA